MFSAVVVLARLTDRIVILCIRLRHNMLRLNTCEWEFKDALHISIY